MVEALNESHATLKTNTMPASGILDPDLVVNVSFRQSVLKNSGYSDKLSFFGRNDCADFAIE